MLAFLLAPLPEQHLGMPRDVSLDGWRIDWLINITIVFVSILFLVMVAWMLWACLRHNTRHTAHYSHGTSRGSILAKGAVAAAIFFGVDGNLFINSTLDLEHRVWNFERVEADPQTLRVEVNAHQWAWDFRVAGPDKQFNTADDIVTLNELRVPVDTPVLIQLGATDVLHSLYIPNLRVKQDAVPGSLARVWFQAREPGEYEIGCAQHCGTNHYKMRATLMVMPQSEFESWAHHASTIAARAFDPADPGAQWGWSWRSP